MKLLTKLILALGLAGAIAAPLSALTIGDADYVGRINDGIPSSPADEVSYINGLIALAPGAGATPFGSETLDRIGSTLTGLPTVVLTGAAKDDTSPSNIVDVTGFEYILGKYDQDQAGSYVWYLGGASPLTGNQELPTSINGHNLSHWSLYNATGGPGDPPGVPEGGTTLALLGLGLGALALIRRQIA